MFLEVVIFLAVFWIWWILEDKRKHKGFPPGPFRFPVLGNLPQISTKSSIPGVAFGQLAKSYGDVMFLKIGKLDTIVFSSHETIMEIFNHDMAAMRAGLKIPVIADRIMGRNLGLLWGNGDVWTTLRRFTLRTLRDFGFGKAQSMDFVINEELEKLNVHMDKLLETNGDGILYFDAFFDLTIINVLWRLVTGVNYTLEDPRMLYLLKISNDMTKSTSFSFDLSIAFPALRDWFPTFFARDEGRKITRDLHSFARETINEHRQAGNYAIDPKGFVDVFLAKIDEYKDEPHPHFNDDNLMITVLDLFQGGAETTSKTLNFGILFMLLNPDVQEKAHKEIISVVSPNEPVTISLKSRLPYSYATLLEVLRHSSVVPFPPMRQAADDFYFHGYLIKKGTSLMPNTYVIHFSESVWENPHAFRPERFLTADGNIDTKMENLVIPFGGGKRMCVGKNLAEANLFLYLTSLLRNYKFTKVPNTPDPSQVPDVGMTHAPKPFSAKVQKRGV